MVEAHERPGPEVEQIVALDRQARRGLRVDGRGHTMENAIGQHELAGRQAESPAIDGNTHGMSPRPGHLDAA